MNIKPMHVVGILVILAVGICAISVLFLTSEEKAPVVIYKTTVPKSQAAESADSRREAKLKERAETSKERILARMQMHGMEADPARLQAMERALASPAYLEYLRKQDAVFPGFNLALWWDFLESQGVSTSGRQLQEENFREHFPTGDYADYEPMMRHSLAELFLETEPPEDPTDRRGMRQYTLAVMGMFRKDWANKIWMRGYFNGYDGDVAWADTIRQNAESIVTEGPAAVTDASSLLTAPAVTTVTSLTDVAEEPQDAQPAQRNENTLFEEAAQQSQNLADVQGNPTELFTVPELPTEESLEKALRQQVSPERFNRAIDILNRYGPREGIRRLKEADPGAAAQVERFLQQKQEDN